MNENTELKNISEMMRYVANKAVASKKLIDDILSLLKKEVRENNNNFNQIAEAILLETITHREYEDLELIYEGQAMMLEKLVEVFRPHIHDVFGEALEDFKDE